MSKNNNNKNSSGKSSLRTPTIKLRQVSMRKGKQICSNCLAQSLATTVRGVMKWIRPHCRFFPGYMIEDENQPERLVEVFTRLFYGPHSKVTRIVCEDESCTKIDFLRWLLSGMGANVFRAIKEKYDFDSILTQNKEIVLEELGQSNGAGVLIAVLLLEKESVKFKEFAEKLKTKAIPKNSILTKEDLRTDDYHNTSLVGRIRKPFQNYIDRFRNKHTISHVMTIVGYNLTHDPPYWEIKNSWGIDWADSGNIRIAMDAFDECVGISQGYIDRLGYTGRTLQKYLDPFERCNVSYIIIKPSDALLSSCKRVDVNNVDESTLYVEEGDYINRYVKCGACGKAQQLRYKINKFPCKSCHQELTVPESWVNETTPFPASVDVRIYPDGGESKNNRRKIILRQAAYFDND